MEAQAADLLETPYYAPGRSYGELIDANPGNYGGTQ